MQHSEHDTPFTPRDWQGFHTLAKQQLPKLIFTFSRMVRYGFILSVVLLIITPWVQTSHGIGQVTALNPDDRAQSITALVSGRIKHWYVRDGSMVKAGDPLVEIIDNDAKLIERLEGERDAMMQNFNLAKIAAETANINYKRQEELFKAGLSSRKDYETAKITYKKYLGEESRALAQLNQVEVKFSRQHAQVLYAPRDGTIVSVLSADNATMVKEGQALATFVPSGVPLAAEIYVDGMDMPLIHEGRKVRLQFEGWPVVQFSGWPSTAIGTFGGVVAFVAPTANIDGKFQVLITPDKDDITWPDERFLRLGAKAKGWVLLDTVSVGYELWRQLNNFPPRYSDKPAGAPIHPDKAEQVL